MLAHSVTEVDGHRSVSVFDTENPEYTRVVDEGHPNLQRLLEALIEKPQDTETIKGLIDPEVAIRKVLSEVSTKVTVDRNGVYVDGIREHGALANLIHDRLYSGDNDWARYVRFLVNLTENPSKSAQDTMFAWVQQHGCTITEDGRVVGFKGLVVGTDPVTGETDVPLSSHRGPNNFIDGVLYGEPDRDYQVPYRLGTIVSKRRRDVEDSRAACATGLHIGAYDYAKDFGENRSAANWNASMGTSAFALVAFNPKDVVTQGLDNVGWKIRVAELEVLEFLDTADDVLDGTTSYDTEDAPLEADEESADLDAVAGEDGASGPAPKPSSKPTLEDYAKSNKALRKDLHDRNLGHKPLARKWSDLTTEASVRRYRQRHDIKVSLRAKVGI